MTSRKLTAADLDALHPRHAPPLHVVRVNKPGEEIIFMGREPDDPLEVIRAELEAVQGTAKNKPHRWTAASGHCLRCGCRQNDVDAIGPCDLYHPLEMIDPATLAALQSAWQQPRPAYMTYQPSPASWRWSDLVVALVFVGVVVWVCFGLFSA